MSHIGVRHRPIRSSHPVVLPARRRHIRAQQQAELVPVGYENLKNVSMVSYRKEYEALLKSGMPPGHARKAVARMIAEKMSSQAGSGMGAGEFFGPGQAYFNALTAAQNKAIAMQAEIAGIGEDVWNKTMAENDYRFAAEGWSPVSDYTYQKMMAFWIGNVNRLITTKSYTPPDAVIKEIGGLAAGTEKMIGIVRDLIPQELAAQATAERREVEAKLAAAGPLVSPGDVARKTLVEELTKRTTGLFGWGAAALAAAAAIAIGLIVALKR